MAERRRARGGGAADPVCQLVLADLEAERLRVAGAEGIHLVRSLRARVGDLYPATDGRGMRARLRVVEVDRAGAEVEVVARQSVPRPARRWWLATGAAGARFDWLVEKAVELGAWGVLPLGRPAASPARRARWDRLARAALGQCLGSWLPEIREPGPLAGVLGAGGAGARGWAAVCVADRDGVPAAGVAPQSLPEGDLLLAVGPPEGFSPAEEALLRAAPGLLRLSLGPRRLRSETAALVGLSWAALGEGAP